MPVSKKHFTQNKEDYQALARPEQSPDLEYDFPTLLRERARPVIRKLLEDILQ